MTVTTQFESVGQRSLQCLLVLQTVIFGSIHALSSVFTELLEACCGTNCWQISFYLLFWAF